MSATSTTDVTGPARPSVQPPTPWAFPAPSSDSLLDNGLRVLTYDVPGQYVISASLTVPLPLSTEPRAVEGIASLMASLLDEGTTSHTSEEFAALLERHGIAFSAGVNDGALMVDVDVPLRHLESALTLMAEALASPVFPVDEVRRLRMARLAEIEQERASAPHRAARELVATLWAPYERASRPTAGTADTVAVITREDIVDFHAERVGPEDAGLVISGALSGVDIEAVLRATFEQWRAPSHTPASRPLAPEVAANAARVIVVDRPGSVQSEIALGWSGPDRHAPGGWAPYPVIGYLLGGSPSARIDAVLREEKGFTYGMRSSFRPRRAGGLFLTTGSVRTDVTVESLETLTDILDPRGLTFTEDEVRAGVDFIAGIAPGRFATADAVAGEAVSLLLDNLPLDFTTTNREATMALTADDLTSAYAGIAPERWCIVVVGDAERFVHEVRDLGLGEVTVVAN